MLDFVASVRAVQAWVEDNGGWEKTLLVVTADHDHLLGGPEAHEVPFQPLGDNGAGKLPSYRWLSSGHSNHLVPVFARGVGADRLLALIAGEDPFRGRYVDQADVYKTMREALVGRPGND
jgi:alkaline phosphatase